MAHHTTNRGNGGADDGAWPWRCLGCEGTLYHDGWYCAACAAVHAIDRRRRTRSDPGRTFRGWIREQSYPSFVTRVAALAGFELVLTALWLHVLLAAAGTVGLPGLG